MFSSKNFVPLSQAEKKLSFISIFIPLLFVILLGLILSFEIVFKIDLNYLGINPRTINGLAGIIFMPLLHENFSHWISNAIPLLVLGFSLIYFYRQVAYKLILAIWFFDGLGVWIMARPALHIGASGLVYGLVSFLLFSGLIRKNKNLLALALTVVVLYGSILYGVFPIDESISWEGHLFGFLAGIGGAVYYKNSGPTDDPIPAWMTEQESDVPNELIDSDADSENLNSQAIIINYEFKPSSEDSKNKG